MRPLLLPMVLMACASTATPPPHHGGEHHHDGHHTAGYHHRFDDVARWTAVFDNPERDAWQRPDEVIAALALTPDARVADLGAGTGYFAARIAPRVATGRVWAIDIEPTMVRYLRERAEREHLGNLFGVLCTADDAMIPERVDVVLIVDTWHHIDNRVAYARHLREALRPNGRVVIVDYTQESPEGPPPAMRLTPAQVDAEMTAAGYTRSGEPRSLPRQYVVTYRADGDARP